MRDLKPCPFCGGKGGRRMRRWGDLPIIVSHNTRTGIITVPHRGGVDMVIVGLNKEIPTGETYDMEAIEWIKTVLHFGDVSALQVTVDCLQKELKRWKGEIVYMDHTR